MSLDLLKERYRGRLPEDEWTKLCEEIDRLYSDALTEFNGTQFAPALAENKTNYVIGINHPLPDNPQKERPGSNQPRRNLLYRTFSIFPF